MMEVATFEGFKEALEALTIEDDEYILVRHVLSPREKIKSHYHPKATEWLIINQGVFHVRIGNEWKSGSLTSEVTVFLFPKKKIHEIEAVTKIEYFVLRDKKDKTIYCKGGN